MSESREEEIISLSYEIASVILHEKYGAFKSYWEDLTQEIAWSVWKAIPRYNEAKGSLKNYIWSIAERTLNHEIRQLVKQREYVTELTEEMENRLSTPEFDPPEEDPRLADLEKFIPTLTRRERKAVDLKLNGASNVAIYNAVYKPKPYKKNIGAAMVYFWRRIESKYETWRIKQMQVNIAKIKGLMAENDESQADLAKVIKCSRNTVCSYLKGKAALSLEAVDKIAKHYQVDPVSLLTVTK